MSASARFACEGGLSVPAMCSTEVACDLRSRQLSNQSSCRTSRWGELGHPKRVVLHFVYKRVTQAQLAESFVDGFANVPGGSGMTAKVDELNGLLKDVVSGDRLTFDFVPGTGTTVTLNGTKLGTVSGDDFGKAFVLVFVGDAPPTAKLKRGMLSR